jgi:hypothetical protein
MTLNFALSISVPRWMVWCHDGRARGESKVPWKKSVGCAILFGCWRLQMAGPDCHVVVEVMILSTEAELGLKTP